MLPQAAEDRQLGGGGGWGRAHIDIFLFRYISYIRVMSDSISFEIQLKNN